MRVEAPSDIEKLVCQQCAQKERFEVAMSTFYRVTVVGGKVVKGDEATTAGVNSIRCLDCGFGGGLIEFQGAMALLEARVYPSAEDCHGRPLRRLAWDGNAMWEMGETGAEAEGSTRIMPMDEVMDKASLSAARVEWAINLLTDLGTTIPVLDDVPEDWESAGQAYGDEWVITECYLFGFPDDDLEVIGKHLRENA